jgi:hypothetical protein
VTKHTRRSHLKLVRVEGDPTEREKEAIREALDRIAELERRATSPSVWLRAGRAQGRRLGMFDYRDRFAHEDAWRLSARFPFGGKEYSGLHGRGDAK